MKKSKKLLSVLLAIVMAFSAFGVAASAYGDYNNVTEEVYDSNDTPRTALFSDEQRGSIVMDLIDNLLGSAQIANMTVVGLKVDLTSYDGLVTTLSQNNLTNLLGLAGDLKNLAYGPLDGAYKRAEIGDAAALMRLLEFAGANKDLIYTVLNKGSLDLGTVGSIGNIDLSAVNNILKDLPAFLGQTVYGLGTRTLPIGDDPAYPNSAAWNTTDVTQNPTLDQILKNLIMKLLTEPSSTVKITAPSQNTLGSQAIPENTVDEDGNPVTYYYCYGLNEDGTLNTTDTDKEKVYLTRWDENSVLLKEFDSSIIDFTGTTLYQFIDKLAPWAYDTFGAPNLDGQFRATLMQFCGAYNAPETDPAIREQLTEKMHTYTAMTPAAMRTAFLNTPGDAGNKNFMYLSLDGQPITKDSKNLYYVVEWNGGYEYYKVDMSGVNKFFDIGNWEYQIGYWANVTKDTIGTAWQSGDSILNRINVIFGNILDEALADSFFTLGTDWTNSVGYGDVTANLTNLIKKVIKLDPQFIFGQDYTLPADFDSYDLEDVAVMVAEVIITKLMKSLVLPESVDSLEEIIVYGVREFTVEILPEYGEAWDTNIAEAAALTGAEKEDAFLEIALNMGTTIGAYYLRNVVGLGTFTDRVEEPYMGPDYDWRQILDYIVNWALELWLPNISSYVQSQYPDIFATDDGLAKLGAVFSQIFPSTAKIFGCSSDTSGLAIDGEVLYEKLRAVLNGDLTQVVSALERKSGTDVLANMSVSKALVTFLKELFGGLGLESSGSWSTLAGRLDAAASSATPIQSLVGAYGGSDGSNEIAVLAQGLIGSLGDTRTIWAQDAIKIVTSFLGYTDVVRFNGVNTSLDQYAYMGSATANVQATVGMSTTGVPDAFNDGAYGTGTTTQDGNYSMVVNKLVVTDDAGTVVASADIGTTLAPGQTGTYGIDVAAPSGLGMYTLTAQVTVTTPAGGTMDIESVQQFIISSATNDGLVDTVHQYTEHLTSNHKNPWPDSRSFSINTDLDLKYGTRDIYISENEQLSKITNVMFTLRDNSVDSRSSNADFIGFQHNKAQAWANTMSVTLNGTAVDSASLWFAPNLTDSTVDRPGATSDAGAQTDRNAVASSAMWKMNDAVTAARGDFTADFTQYVANVDVTLQYNWAAITKSLVNYADGSESKDNNSTHQMPVNIIIYNSYGLESLLNSELAAARDRADYVDGASADAAWATYEAALQEAVNQMYLNWNAETFAADHTSAEGVSTFKLAFDALTAAVNGLTAYEDTEAVKTDVIAPSDPRSELYDAYTRLRTQFENNYSNQDFLMYRWLKYFNLRASLSSLMNSATPPSGVAEDTLAGVPSDEIDAALAAIADADIKVLADLLVEEPTAEEIAAAAKELEDFVMPSYDLALVMNDVTNMETYETRMFEKDVYPYYLQKAIADYGNVTNTDGAYTAESFANYTAALANANAALTATKPSSIHAARYNFLVAYNSLVKTAEAADYTALDAAKAQADAILADMANYKATAASGLTDQEAFAALLAAVGYEVTVGDSTYIIGGDYTGVSATNQKGTLRRTVDQSWVDGVAEKMNAALANIEPVASEPNTLVVKDAFEFASDVIIDKQVIGVYKEWYVGEFDNAEDADFTGLVYGVEVFDCTLTDALTTTLGDEYLRVTQTEAADGYDSTGTKLEVLNADGTVAETYYFVYFGDINADGVVDPSDTGDCVKYVNGNLSFASIAQFIASDANADTVTDPSDTTAIVRMVNGNSTATQGELAAKFYEEYQAQL